MLFDKKPIFLSNLDMVDVIFLSINFDGHFVPDDVYVAKYGKYLWNRPESLFDYKKKQAFRPVPQRTLFRN